MTRGGGRHSRPTTLFGNTLASKALNAASYKADEEWIPCVYVVSKVEDQACVGSWIAALSPLDVKLPFYYKFAFILTILNSEQTSPWQNCRDSQSPGSYSSCD